MHCWVRVWQARTGAKSMVRLEGERLRLHVRGRPGFLGTPLAWNSRDVRVRRIPVAHVHFKTRLVHDSVLNSFQPVIPPAHGLGTPFDRRTGFGFVRESVIPWPDQSFNGRFGMFEKARNGIAIAVEEAADHETRNGVIRVMVWRHGCSPPKFAVALVMKIERKPWFGIEARRQRFFIRGKIGRAS